LYWRFNKRYSAQHLKANSLKQALAASVSLIVMCPLHLVGGRRLARNETK
jgi:hypothetical protein